ncbi:MAG: peptide deformylase [Candidatus Fermentibacteraceae bacterium]
MPREIQLLGSPVLRRKSRELTPEDARLLEDVLGDMKRIIRQEDGLGLAAPQVGENLRVFILRPGSLPELGVRCVFVNPELTTSGAEARHEEGCLSIPGIYESFRRPSTVAVEALDEDLRPFRLELGGLASRAVQHETDHLNGVLFIDHLSPVKKRLLRGKLSAIREEAARRGQLA